MNREYKKCCKQKLHKLWKLANCRKNIAIIENYYADVWFLIKLFSKK